MVTSENTRSPNKGLFASRASQIQQELNEERQNAVQARVRSRNEGKLIPQTRVMSKAVALAAAVPTHPSSLGPDPRRILGVSPSILTGALVAAIPAIVAAISATSRAATAEERAQAWQESLKSIIAALGIGGLAGYLKEAIEAKLLQLGSMLSDKEVLQSFARRVTNIKAPVAQVGAEGLYYAVKGLWHSMCKLIARQRNDGETVAAEQAKLDEICSFDTVCRILAHSLAVALGAACTGGLISAGLVTGDACWYLPVLVSVVAVFISDAVIEAMIVKKRQAGSWGDWFLSFFINDRRIYIWAGGALEANEHDPTLRELECAISHCIVVDPVRSTLSGHLYERHEIMAWIKQHGTDPVLHGEKVTALDYIDAPVTKMWAHALASELDAQLVLG